MSAHVAWATTSILPCLLLSLGPPVLFLEHFRETSDISVFLNTFKSFLIIIIIIII